MNSGDLVIQSFVVKIWLDDVSGDDRLPTWRGHITHVPGGEQQSLKDLREVATFITPYIEAMGVKAESRWSLQRLLAWRKQA